MNTVQRLVANGCSYMANYSGGGGHLDLARQLGIDSAHDLSRAGSSNDRLLRTTVRDSISTDKPTFYLLGLSFFSRFEYPIDAVNSSNDTVDGPWVSIQNSVPDFPNHDNQLLSHKDLNSLFELKQKLVIQGGYWYFEDFCLNLVSSINHLKQLGHVCTVFMNADYQHLEWIKESRFEFLKNYPEIIDGLEWLAIPWQHEQNVPAQQDSRVTPELQHRVQGEHHELNKFIMDYIKTHPEIYSDYFENV